MECGRCHPAGVSIRPHSLREEEASSVLDPTKELSKVLFPGVRTRRGLSATLRAVAINPPLEYHCTKLFKPSKAGFSIKSCKNLLFLIV